jgi:hypothetical protein
MAPSRPPRRIRTLLVAGTATVIVGILGLLARAGWTAGAVLTLDAAPVNVHSVDCGTVGFRMPGMAIDVTSPSGWPGTISIAKDTHPYAPNTQADRAIPTYSIKWDVFRSMTWINEEYVTYSHGYLDATLTGGHHLIGVLRCR